MVSRACLIAALASLAGDGVAQTASALPDWRRAGGDLFIAPVDPVEPTSTIGLPGGAPAAASLEPPRQPYATAIDAAARRHGLDPKLLHALVVVESAYRPQACSPAGACGLTQLMPATAVELGVIDRMDPVTSLNGGADYLARQLSRFGDLRLALAAYNAGPSRVARLGRIPSIPETQTYVVSVIDCYLALTAGRSVRNARDCRPLGGPG